MTYTSKRYLFDLARGGDERPFCLVASYIHPHDPYINRPEYWNLYRDDEIDLPAVAARDVEDDPHSRRLRAAMAMDDPAPSEAQVRAARHGYYASVSYLDARIGELLAALAECGFADDTLVLFTSDHGDMLGERGLWFKMNWFENSARVPLVAHWPSAFPARRVANAVSLVDLLPSLAELASDGAGLDYATPLEGRSLVPHLSGGGGHDEAVGEYFGEGTATPLFMIRRERFKYVAAEGDPPQLYDLAEDPQERANLAADERRRDALALFRDEAERRWDVAALKEAVLESQRRRRFVAPVLRDQASSWDYQPPASAGASYIRNDMPIGEIERRARFPAV